MYDQALALTESAEARIAATNDIVSPDLGGALCAEDHQL